VHRLVTGTPERLSLHVLAALCDIFESDPAALIETSAQNAGARLAVGSDTPAAPAAPEHLRPVAARILPEP
jgi:hypothetical protein